MAQRASFMSEPNFLENELNLALINELKVLFMYYIIAQWGTDDFLQRIEHIRNDRTESKDYVSTDSLRRLCFNRQIIVNVV